MRTYVFKCVNHKCNEFNKPVDFRYTVEEYVTARDSLTCGSCGEKMSRAYNLTPVIYKMTYGPDEYGDI